MFLGEKWTDGFVLRVTNNSKILFYCVFLGSRVVVKSLTVTNIPSAAKEIDISLLSRTHSVKMRMNM